MEQRLEFRDNDTLIIHPAGVDYQDVLQTGIHEDLAKAWGIADKDRKVPGLSTRMFYKDQNVHYTQNDTHADNVKLQYQGKDYKWAVLKARVGWES